MVPLFYNKVFSDHTSMQYTYADLPFVCPPSGRKHPGARLTSGSSISLNLGEVLRGDRITVSDYELPMAEDQEVRYLCSHKVDAKAVAWGQQLVKDRYLVEWIVDNLPGATSFVTTDKSRKYYSAGWKLGYEEFDREIMKPRFYLNNHVTMVFRYRRAPGKAGDRGKKVIVGFEVYPKSIEAGNRNLTTGVPYDLSDIEKPMELTLISNVTNSDGTYTATEDRELIIPFTYSVYWREDENVEWKSRWDMYFVHDDENATVHWLAIVNAFVILGRLTAVVGVIFTRTIRGDIKGFTETPSLEEGKMKQIRSRQGLRSPRKSIDKSSLLDPIDPADDDLSSDDEGGEDASGWKLLKQDVFRPPAYGPLLAPLVGSGTQLVFMASGLMILSCFGVLNPSFRGGYVSVGTGLFVIAGLFSGYFSSRVYKTFGGQLWLHNVIVTGTLVPGLIFATIFILNLFVWAHSSSTAIPFGTLIALLMLWLLIQLPLVLFGGWVAWRHVGPWEHPVKPSPIPRQIPSQSWYMKSNLQVILLAGLVPFGVIFIELMFVFKSLWAEKAAYYYVPGFMAAAGVVLTLAVVEVTIVAVYVQLCAEVRLLRRTRKDGVLTFDTELPMVVAVILRWWLVFALGVCLLRVVLHAKAKHSRLHEQFALLQLLLFGMSSLRAVDRHDRLLGRICVCEENLHVSHLIHRGSNESDQSSAIKVD
jgi:transmembrane 9 superfamily protein 2/4